jgi:hypothetical protein
MLPYLKGHWQSRWCDHSRKQEDCRHLFGNCQKDCPPERRSFQSACGDGQSTYHCLAYSHFCCLCYLKKEIFDVTEMLQRLSPDPQAGICFPTNCLREWVKSPHCCATVAPVQPLTKHHCWQKTLVALQPHSRGTPSWLSCASCDCANKPQTPVSPSSQYLLAHTWEDNTGVDNISICHLPVDDPRIHVQDCVICDSVHLCESVVPISNVQKVVPISEVWKFSSRQDQQLNSFVISFRKLVILPAQKHVRQLRTFMQYSFVRTPKDLWNNMKEQHLNTEKRQLSTSVAKIGIQWWLCRQDTCVIPVQLTNL